MDFKAALNDFLAHMDGVVDAHNAVNTIAQYGKHEIAYGRKYHKISKGSTGVGSSVVCFIDNEGNIYKAASWKVPAKGIRASIHKPESYAHADLYGGWLYR